MQNNSLKFFLILSVIVHGVFFFGKINSKTKNISNYSVKNLGESSKRTTLKLKSFPPKPKFKKRIVKKGKKKVLRKRMVVAKPVTNVETSVVKNNKNRSGVKSAKNLYLKKIRDMVLEAKVYPRVARRLKQQGVVDVYFEVSWPNKIKNVQVQKESSYGSLNRSARQAVESLEDLPQMPDVLKTEVLEIKIPISFKLL